MGKNVSKIKRQLAKRDPQDIAMPGFTLTAIGVVVDGKPTLDQWQEAMHFIDRAASASMWWHGDMLNYGYATYDELESKEEGDGRFDEKTLRNAKWVAASVSMSLRKDTLSFGHHNIVAPLKPSDQKRWLARAVKEKMTVAQLRKAIREERIALERSRFPLPEGQFRVLYADPPWKYSDELIEGYGAAEHHYPTLTIDELSELADDSGRKVAELPFDDAAIFLWTTSPLLDDAFLVMEAWGFEYKTSFVWDKVLHNYGHYNSVRHEFLLLGTRGSCLPDSETLRDSVVQVERTDDHSSKPDIFYEIIEEMYQHGPRLESFARRKRKGWTAWGNAV